MTNPAGLILAGGASSRMGEPKALVVLEGKPLIAHVRDWMAPHVSQIALGAGANAEMLARFGLPCLDDGISGQQGPASGVLAGLEWAAARGADHLLTAPCDMPYLPPSLPDTLKNAMTGGPVYAQSARGFHYAVALWPVALAPPFRALMEQDGVRALHRLLGHFGGLAVTIEGEIGFADLNSPADLNR